ncbi:PaaX family transcriptional regulator C-terminal domain-containing protein [Nocardioides sp.]|uniref:PaaX family transcriptional regulator C-terminal domain-containing protein n=1 Tax=Nocardioides sp. TaxID=35761 RepID=UPI00356593AC
MSPDSNAVDLQPLSARSVVLSLMLGAFPEPMSPAALTRAGEHFGIASSTVRVALTRAVAAGDLRREDGAYALGERLADRQRRQDEAADDAERPWDGSWEMAVVTVTGRSSPERAALRDELGEARMAELREGVWTRPANLRREPGYRSQSVLACFTARPDGDPAVLASRLWDLAGWSERGRMLMSRFERTRDPAARFAAAAHLVRHLATDPLLPAPLLPPNWPGDALRATYAGYQVELGELASGEVNSSTTKLAPPSASAQ